MRTYSFSLSDHLGNIRLVVDEQGQVQQKNEYGEERREKMGREKKRENFVATGTNYLDYGARMYQPELGRWNVVDPLGEENRRWSSYNYAYDNPIRFIDPDGMRGRESNLGKDSKNGIETGPTFYTESVTILLGTDYSDGYSTGNTLSSTGGVDVLVDNSGNKNINENNSIVIDKGKKSKENSKGAGAKSSGGTGEINLTDHFMYPGVSIKLNPESTQGYFNPITKSINLPGWVQNDPVKQRDYIRHEYGHYLQQEKYGLVDFLFIVTPVSIFSAKDPNHLYIWTEIEANKMANDYFQSRFPTNYGSFFDRDTYRIK